MVAGRFGPPLSIRNSQAFGFVFFACVLRTCDFLDKSLACLNGLQLSLLWASLSLLRRSYFARLTGLLLGAVEFVALARTRSVVSLV
jgi:hypothetical protein